MVQKAVLLVGSLKGRSSTSNSLGSYLTEKLKDNGITSEKVFIGGSLATDKKRASMFRLIDDADLIILAFPLYVDSLPTQVIHTLELIAEHAKLKKGMGEKNFVAIVNSGFPETRQNDTAVAVCRIFAKQVGFNWAGGLAMGGGGMIAGQPLDEMGGQVRNQKKALEIAAESLARGESIPEKAVVLMGKLGFPRWMYLWNANRRWKQDAREHIEKEEMYNQPFVEAVSTQRSSRADHRVADRSTVEVQKVEVQCKS